MNRNVIEDAKKDLLLYSILCDERYKPSRCHRFIANKLGEVADGKAKRVIINMPPQHGKSRLVAIEFATWMMAKNPRIKVAVASYASSLSETHSREARARMASEAYTGMFGDLLNDASKKIEDWGTNKGGGYRAVGVGGALTGRAVDIMIIDDPFKGPEDANSPSQREKVWEWYKAVAHTRLSPEGVIILIMTRWHEDDLVGRLTKPQYIKEMEDKGVVSEVWDVVKLRGVAEKDDPMRRNEGSALWPEKYNATHLKAKENVLGPYLWSALYRQDPVPQGGNYIQVEKLKTISKHDVPSGLRWFRFWDLGGTKKDELKKNEPDYTAGIKGAFGPNGEFYLADLVFGQWDWLVSRSTIKAVAESERILVGIEAVAGFKTAYANLREVVDPEVCLLEIGEDQDKLTRALPWISLVNQGKVYLVQGDWTGAFFLQALAFPQGAHDDIMDSVSGVYHMHKQGREIFVA